MIPATLPVYTGVIVSNPDHPRAGQAGSFFGANKEAPETRVDVRYDSDGQTVATDRADLKKLGD